ncbi:hypothetical protein GBAR_LOCUS29123 [Geodia barretti]|uniref:Uncharacterized protein n=1 Tax=Geodia barretti TaxID=519541 RepID=A0AA35TRV3_GEOBA|nr:hypothetical protein GBAR_LOCUS29123 [Geodia barretti]
MVCGYFVKTTVIYCQFEVTKSAGPKLMLLCSFAKHHIESFWLTNRKQ